jgi:hypothetical protein
LGVEPSMFDVCFSTWPEKLSPARLFGVLCFGS